MWLKKQLQQAQQQLVNLADGDVREKASQLVRGNLVKASKVAESGLGAPSASSEARLLNPAPLSWPPL